MHVLDCIRNGFNEITVITADTDVVVIALGCFYLLRPEKLWIEFGVGKHRRWLPIHTYVNILGESKCAGLLFWYAFTGCDTVSSFRGRRKKTAWNIWNSFPEVTEAFINLSQNDSIQENDLQLIERYVVLLYDKMSPLMTVNECRRELFSHKCRPIESCPPTCNELIQHVKRAMLQSNIWLQSVQLTIFERDICNFGWIVNSESRAEPLWVTILKYVKN